MNKKLIIFLIVFSSILMNNSLLANSTLPVPRFVTIKSNKVNVRKGPLQNSRKVWVFVKAGEPVKIISEYGEWREIRDIMNEGGWVHSRLLSPKRSVIIKNKRLLFSAQNKNSRVIAKLAANLRCKLYTCKQNWCNVRCQSYKGWIIRDDSIWGIYDHEYK